MNDEPIDGARLRLKPQTSPVRTVLARERADQLRREAARLAQRRYSRLVLRHALDQADVELDVAAVIEAWQLRRGDRVGTSRLR
jgi:hypothetical protein